MESPQDRTIQIGKIRARYWDEGSQGEPVVLIHGLGGYVENWLPSFDALAAQHRVVAVDLPGHGRSGSAEFARTAVHDPAVITDALIELDYEIGLQPGAQAASLRPCSSFWAVERITL